MPEPRQPLETPVAFLIFRRPDLTAQVFAAIRRAQPKKLLVVADGPRNAQEKALCDAARAQIVVDWDCELLTNYAEVNLGCKQRVASGIDWVFEQCAEAIILEDDTLPSDSFFPFCQELLARYRNDERVMCICGMNLYPGRSRRADETYFYARYGGGATNGWASWRRAWKHFDVDMKDWPGFKRAGGIKDLFSSLAEQFYWTHLFDLQHEGQINTWDYQWLYARFTQAGLTAVPSVNLVSNLGFRSDGTHTVAEVPKVWAAANRNHELWEWIAPQHVLAHREVDAYCFNAFHNPQGVAGLASLALIRLRAEARRLFGRQARE